jgi:hypothetical protein
MIGEEQNNDFQEPPAQEVNLDSKLYVQPPDATQDADAGTDPEGSSYSLFRAPAHGRAHTNTNAPTYSLFWSPDATA